MELKLTNVAKSSMHELLLDYEDYLLTRRLEKWAVDDPRTQQTRSYTRSHMLPEQYQHVVDTRSAETAANIAITMLHQFDVLITSLIEAQKRRFLAEGASRNRCIVRACRLEADILIIVRVLRMLRVLGVLRVRRTKQKKTGFML